MMEWKAAVAAAVLVVLLVADPAALGGLRAACGCQEQGTRTCSGGSCCIVKSPCRARHHDAPDAAPGHGHAAAASEASAKLCGCALRSGASEPFEAAVTQPRMHEGLLASAIGVPQPIPEKTLTPAEIALPASFVLTPEAPPPRLVV